MPGEDDALEKLSGAVEALKFFLSNLWTIGVLFAVLGGLEVVATSHGYKFNEEVTSWSPAVMLLGCGLIVVSVITFVTDHAIKRLGSLWSKFENDRLSRENNDNAIANLQTLSDFQIGELFFYLSSTADRFDVSMSAHRMELISKGILEIITQTSAYNCVCKLNKGVSDHKEELLKNYSSLIRSCPNRFPTEAHLLYLQDEAIESQTKE